MDELDGVLELPQKAVYKRYSGDYTHSDGYERGYGSYGAGRGFGGGSGGYGGFGQGSRSRRETVTYVGTYSGSKEESAFRTFGAGNAPKRDVRPSDSAPVVRFGNAGTTVAPQQPRKDTSGFAVGVRVRHARFGDGVVTAMRGAGSNVIITVKFEKAGNKDLAAALAPLEILQ